MTGCRRIELLNLRWRNVGVDTLNHADSKSGPRAEPLHETARALIAALPCARGPNAILSPRYAEARSQPRLIACWRAVCPDAELASLRLNDSGLPPLVRWRWRARTCCWKVSSLGTGDFGPRQATPT